MLSAPARLPLLLRPTRLAGAWAYVLTRRGAERLLAARNELLTHPVDLYMGHRATSDLRSFAFATPPGFFGEIPPFGSERSNYFGIVKVDYLPSMIGDRETA